LSHAELHIDSSDIATLMSEADLAIGACGSASWERCCLGLPAVAIISGGDQKLVGRALAEAGAAVVGSLADIDPDWITARLRDFADDPDQLRRMSSEAARLCDGQGAQRVVQAVSSITKGVAAHA